MTRTELNELRLETLTFQHKLTRRPGSVCITRFNSILALRNSETKEVTHLVQPSHSNGVIVVIGRQEELSVPRYEPETAKEWLNAVDEEFNKRQKKVQKDIGYHFEKCVLSEKQLKQAVLKQVKDRAEYLRKLSKLSDDTLSRF